MARITLCLGITNREYLDSIMSYFRSSEYESQFTLRAFSQKESIENIIFENQSIDLLLIEPDLLPNQVGQIRSIVLLTEGQMPFDTYPTLEKYQPLNILFAKLMSIFAGSDELAVAKLSGNRSCQIVSVYSATGGSGKTAVAVALSQVIALEGKKILYLNLELINGNSAFLELKGENGLDKLLFSVHSNPVQLQQKIIQLKKNDSFMKFDYYEPLNSLKDLQDITEEDMNGLLLAITGSGHYDYIVLDLDSTIDNRNLSALANSDHIIWLINDEIQSMKKNEKLYAYYLEKNNKISKKVTFVANKYMGRLKNQFNYPLNQFLPYVPDWKVVESGKQWVSEPVFNEQLSKLKATLTGH